jgi:hypothetical protein
MVAQRLGERNLLARVLLRRHSQQEETIMKTLSAVLAAIVVSSAFAQSRGGSTGPFTGYEADVLSEVWPQIREAADFEDINWRAHGLDRAPGSREAQRLLATHWDEARQAPRFSSIDWDELADGDWRDDRRDRRGSDERFGRQYPADDGDFYETGPFTRQEAALMSRLWSQIREAGSYEDIDWRAHGVREPGDREAQRIMASNWGQLREAARFEDINWEATLARSPTRVFR